jgi:hypothetical protein
VLVIWVLVRDWSEQVTVEFTGPRIDLPGDDGLGASCRIERRGSKGNCHSDIIRIDLLSPKFRLH